MPASNATPAASPATQAQAVVGHSAGKRRALLAFFVINVFLFASLGLWQVQRLDWKRDLIARVTSRVAAQPVAAPAPGEWPVLTRENAEYRRITLHGELLIAQEVAVYTVTDLGPGYWVMAPLRLTGLTGADAQEADRNQQAIVWINRGFVPMEMRRPAARPAQEAEHAATTITGLLRLADASSVFLRSNAPGEDRWYRRDPQEFSAARTVAAWRTAPYYVDAERSAGDPPWLTAGLTQVQFRNNHLSYAITWFVLAALNIAAFVFLLWWEPKLRQHGHGLPGD